ncbi:hypothetical protein [Allokutzneria albata]|uniref:Uncharacterized protein n=1 Tax=Allokutzneria albata TaxID=211114 RepID=A0A1G9SCZ6_ALLAB|nr:hypothetical protein [Allokutzneria albata]SDM32675.1 hypothetical protein SAMN04489726_1033 [Allokutzneria albata]
MVGAAEQQELLQEVSGLLVSAAPEGWRELELSFRSTVAVDTATFSCVGGSGERTRLSVPFRAMNRLSELREGMYAPGTGAWFTARMTIRPPGGFEVRYDYDSEPEFVPPLTPETFVLDQEHFPRSEEHMPEWLKDKLAQAGQS